MVTLLKNPLKKHDLIYKDELVREHLPRVQRIARRYANCLPYEEREEVFSAATLGLVEACNRYTEGMNTAFWTFAQSRVVGAIQDDLRKKDPLTRSQRRKVKSVNRAYLEHTQVHGERPGEEALVRASGMSLSEVREARHLSRVVRFVSFEDHESRDDGTFNARISDESNMVPEAAAVCCEQKQMVRELVCDLPERERQVVEYLYYEGRTPREIATLLDVSEGRISQLNKMAVSRLRKKISVS